jgi:hypothetical protein
MRLFRGLGDLLDEAVVRVLAEGGDGVVDAAFVEEDLDLGLPVMRSPRAEGAEDLFAERRPPLAGERLR